MWERVLALLTTKQLDVHPIIGGMWSVTEWHTAFEKMHKGEVVKSVLKPVNKMRLKDKVVIVTGSTTGIGKAIAIHCVAKQRQSGSKWT